jgi:DMSO reductase anchor subunit
VLPAFMGTVLLYGLAHLTAINPVLLRLGSGIAIDATVTLGTLGTVLAFALFVCTAMIYASVRFLREWATPLTVSNYILLGGASGFSLAAALAANVAPELLQFFGGWALVLTLLGAASRSASLLRNARLKPTSTLQTAIGIKHPRIVQKSQGFLGGSFNTREFFHGRTPALLRSVKWAFLVAAFALPALLLAAGAWAGHDALLELAFVVQFLGLLAERWFFFAQANHPQNLYYRAIA